MPNYTKEQWNAKKEGLMEKCYDCFAEYGLHGTGRGAQGTVLCAMLTLSG